MSQEHQTEVERTMAELNFFDAVKRALREEMANDDRVMCIGEDIRSHGGPYGTTKGLMELYGEKRVIDTPIIESAFFDAAVGLSLMGWRPVVDLMAADFITLCVDQVIHGASHYPFMFDVQIPLTIRGPIGGGLRFTASQEKSLEAMIANFPGLIIVYPSSALDAYGLLKSAIRSNDPCIVFEHKLLYFYSVSDEFPEDEFTIPLGEAAVKRTGTDLTIVSWGWPVRESVKAAEVLSETEGIEVEVVDLRTLRPMDRATILESVKKTNRAMVVTEAHRFGSIGAEVAATIQEFGFDDLDAPVARLGAPEYPIPFSAPIQDAYLMTADKILQTIKELLV
jgi:pyruvate/2-oxoglutarate/acetoin dehydrogenase E1 component|tara:strand:+ start:6015 stop:7028 length:1014 start_codon:yes stop_codon:yes gene_type:complete